MGKSERAQLTNPKKVSIIQKDKDNEKEEYGLPLIRENSPWLEGDLKEGIRKVAFESGG